MTKKRTQAGEISYLLRLSLISLLFFVGITTVSAKANSEKQSLTLNVDQQRVESVLDEIENQTELDFAYSNDLIDLDRLVSVKASNSDVDAVLAEVFEETGVAWKVKDSKILLYPAKKETKSDVVDQDRSISGVVKDFSGETIVGASVTIQGTTKGVVTDLDGKYRITGLSAGDVITISFIGMVPQNFTVGDQEVIDVRLKLDAFGLDDVIVVGYATQKKANLTGAVATADMEALESRPVSSAAQMLQGVVPGLNIKQSSGELDSSPSINVRGVATIGSGSSGSPLVLIDGMEGDINAINAQDIESISVLKDAAASSIYGSRAPFGVILVQTKKGVKGKTKINYNNNFRWSSPINMPDMMNSLNFAYYFNDAGTNAGQGVTFSDERIQRIKDYMAGTITESTTVDERNGQYWNSGYRDGNDNIDWYEALFREVAMAHEHNLSISGGSDKFQFYGSANFLDQDGFMEFNQEEFNRYATTLKLSGELTEDLMINLTNRFIREDMKRPSQLTSSLFKDLARQGWPVLPLYDPNGYLLDSPSPALGLRDGGEDITQTDWLYQQAQLIYEPIENLKVYGELNYKTKNQFRHWDTQITYNHDIYGNPYASDKTAQVYEYATRENYFSSNIYSEYSKTLDSGHYFKGMIGFQAELNKVRDLSAQRQGIIVPEIPVLDATSGTDYNGNAVVPTVSGSYDDWATNGYFARANYNFKERYLLEVNVRYDGTSRFRSDERWKMFPSVSAGWNLAQEDFWSDFASDVTILKVRASYGELGNQNTTDLYPTYVTMPVGASDGSWLIDGVQPNTSDAPGLVSQSLTWERVRNWNFGLDFAMLDNRLAANFDYYVRYTDDMVGPAPELPVTLGTSVPKVNNTNLKTSGFELSLNWNDILDNGLGYNVSFMLSDSKTEIVSYPNPTNSLSTYRDGMMMGEIWGLETVGIAKSKEEMDSHLASLPNGGQDAIGTQFDAGDIMYEDLNGDGKIDKGANTLDDHGDLKIIGNSTSRYSFSLNLGANYKGFDFSAFFQGVMKRDIFQNGDYFWGAGKAKWWSTAMVEHEDYFRADESHPLGQNLDSYYARPLFGSTATKNTQVQSRYLQNAAYVRLKNLQIGYTIPSDLAKRLNLQKLRVFASGENLCTITNMSTIFDPETVDAGWSGNGNAYPLSRVIAVGLSVNL